jgi:hypothetical protein
MGTIFLIRLQSRKLSALAPFRSSIQPMFYCRESKIKIIGSIALTHPQV